MVNPARAWLTLGRLLAAKNPEVSLSIGLTELQKWETVAEVIGRADQAMYQRRRSRRQGGYT